MLPLSEPFPGPLLESGMRPLARYGDHQEIMSRSLNRCILYLAQDWSGPGRGLCSSRTQINAGGWCHY